MNKKINFTYKEQVERCRLEIQLIEKRMLELKQNKIKLESKINLLRKNRQK